MSDPIQIVLISVISLLTILLFIIGIEIFQILKELKKSLEKGNKILDDAGRITESVAEPIEQASDFLMGLRKGIAFFDTVAKFFKNKGKKSKPKTEEEETVQEAGEIAETEEETKTAEKEENKKSTRSKSHPEGKPAGKRRFFTRKGKSLGK